MIQNLYKLLVLAEVYAHRDVNKTTSVKIKTNSAKVLVKPNDKMLQIFCNPNNAIIVKLQCNENRLSNF